MSNEHESRLRGRARAACARARESPRQRVSLGMHFPSPQTEARLGDRAVLLPLARVSTTGAHNVWRFPVPPSSVGNDTGDRAHKGETRLLAQAPPSRPAIP